MLFIGGISQGRKLLNYARSILCGSCGSTSQCQVFMTYMYFSFFFIPLFKWNKRFYVHPPTFTWSRKENTPAPGRKVPEIPTRSVCAADLRQTKIITTVRSAGDGYKERLRKTSAALSGICFPCVLNEQTVCDSRQ